MYFKTHINIKNIAKKCKKFCKKIANLQKKLHWFSLFEVLYNWVKFRRLKMGDPVDLIKKSNIQRKRLIYRVSQF